MNWQVINPGRGWGGLPYKKDGDARRTFLGLKRKKAVLVALRMFSLKRSTAGFLAVPYRVLNRKVMTGDI